jgi:hypothetical protein
MPKILDQFINEAKLPSVEVEFSRKSTIEICIAFFITAILIHLSIKILNKIA